MGKVAEKAKVKRQEILNQVLDNIPAAEFGDTTVKGMCDAAGISVGTFYHYFADKADFMSELFGLTDNFIENELRGTLTFENEVENYLTFCRRIAEFMTESGPARSELVYSIVPRFDRLPNPDGREENRPFFSVLREILERGREKGHFTRGIDPERICYITVTMLRGYCYDWAKHGGSYDLTAYVMEFVELFLRVLVA